MKAVVLREHGAGGVRHETDFAYPAPGTGDVVEQVRAAALNYDYIFTRRGMTGIKIPMPAIMGLDNAGTIAATDREVLDRKLGARVLGDPINRVEDGLTGETVHGGPIAAIIDTLGEYVLVMLLGWPCRS
jgi:alcohol dehydrogenase